jgi:hypothetical protein
MVHRASAPIREAAAKWLRSGEHDGRRLLRRRGARVAHAEKREAHPGDRNDRGSPGRARADLRASAVILDRRGSGPYESRCACGTLEQAVAFQFEAVPQHRSEGAEVALRRGRLVSRPPEPCEEGVFALVHDHVVRFDLTVHEAGHVRGIECLRDLAEEDDGSSPVQPVVVKEPGEGRTAHELTGDEHPVGGLAEPVHGDCVRVPPGCLERRLATAGSAPSVLAQHREGHATVE